MATGGDQDIPLENIFDNVDLSKLPDALKKKLDLEKIERMLKDPKSLSILVTGKTGAGKSTLINGILGMKMNDAEFAPEGDSLESPCTLQLTPYKKTKGRIHVTVWDSRGLLDGSPEKVQTESLKEMVKNCYNVDLKLICIEMNQRRFVRGTDNPDVAAMIKITEAFGVDFWKSVVIVLTFANEIKSRFPEDLTKEQKADKFSEKLDEWKTLLNKILCEDVSIPRKIVNQIKVVPAGHYREWELPDRDYWLSDLWFECLDALPTPESKGALLNLNYDRITPPEEVKPNDRLKPAEDQPIVIPTADKMPALVEVLKVLGCAAGGAASGGVIGLTALAAGGIGAAIGVPVGAIMGFCIGLALGVHKIQNEEDTKKNK